MTDEPTTSHTFNPTEAQNETMAALAWLTRHLGCWSDYPQSCLDGDTGELYFSSNCITFGLDKQRILIRPDGMITRNGEVR